jgi:HK97 family phage prohead protease
MSEKYDFSGWATKNDLKCADGRTIRRGAFKDQDGETVPLVWQHVHNDPTNVLGHALLKNKDQGVYAYCSLNDTPSGEYVKELIKHGDVNALSIYANRLQQNGGDVLHGTIREVSLVLAGANPGATIDNVYIEHGIDSDEEAIICTGDDLVLAHADTEEKDTTMADEKKNTSDTATEDKNDSKEVRTVKDVFDEMTKEQQAVVYYMIGQALEDAGVEDDTEEDASEDTEMAASAFNDEGDYTDMKHNVFDNDETMKSDTLSHADIDALVADSLADAKGFGSLRDSVMAHAAQDYGIEDIDILFPDAKTITSQPDFIQREMGWVSTVMNGTHHIPFTRVKSVLANITEDEARARGYLKGHKKKDEVFSLLKRTTDPQTIYKRQKLDRDDTIDITDFDVVAWLKGEMRIMLDEEIARAVLIGDGRLASDDDHISEEHVRPIYSDDDLYTIKVTAKTDTDELKAAENFITAVIKSRKDYKGSGTPTLFTTEDMLTDMLLIKDGMGHFMYKSAAELATTLRVSSIVTVPVMEGQKGKKGGSLLGIVVNLTDYVIGADKGGQVSMFDDFDIDYNQMKYLIETRISGAMTRPFAAIAIESGADYTTTGFTVPKKTAGSGTGTGSTGA